MDSKEIFDTFQWFNNSWKSHRSYRGTIVWVDWNGEQHVATNKEELWQQLSEAPLCQTRPHTK